MNYVSYASTQLRVSLGAIQSNNYTITANGMHKGTYTITVGQNKAGAVEVGADGVLTAHGLSVGNGKELTIQLE